MSHLSDKELDRLSREAAEQYDVEQNTSGWDNLHLRLEKEMPVNARKQRRSLLLLLSLLVLLTGSGLVYQYVNGPSPKIDKVAGTRTQTEPSDVPDDQSAVAQHQTERSNRKQLNDVPTPTTEKNNSNPATGTTGQKEPSIADHQKTDIVSGATEHPSTIQKTKPTIAGSAKDLQRSETINRTTPRTKKVNSTIDRLGTPTSGKQKNVSGRNGSPAKSEAIPNSIVSGEKSTLDDPGNKIAVSDQMNTNHEHAASVVSRFDVAFISISKPAINKKNIEIVLPINAASAPAIARKNQEQRITRKFPFSIAVTGGTDWTSVRFTHNDKAGYNAGVLLSWHFANKFSLSTGALYTKKNYSAYGKDYHPPKGYWTNYITLDELNGSCWMIDIPLNLRYDFAGGKQYNFFGSAGVSTYLMDKESYTYHYMYNGSYARRNWLNENNSSHVFSILNVSAGYEKSVGKKLSVQMEPYLKVPVAGIGFGKMQMNSYGINFAIRYRPEFKKQHTTVPGIHP